MTVIRKLIMSFLVIMFVPIIAIIAMFSLDTVKREKIDIEINRGSIIELSKEFSFFSMNTKQSLNNIFNRINESKNIFSKIGDEKTPKNNKITFVEMLKEVYPAINNMSKSITKIKDMSKMVSDFERQQREIAKIIGSQDATLMDIAQRITENPTRAKYSIQDYKQASDELNIMIEQINLK